MKTDRATWRPVALLAIIIAAGAAPGAAYSQAAVEPKPELYEDLKAMDRDGDNRVSTQEFKSALPQRAGLTPGEFAALDADGDDRLSVWESQADATFAKQFMHKDRNRDGYVTSDELRGTPPTP